MADRFQTKLVAVIATVFTIWLAWSAVLFVLDAVNADAKAHTPSDWRR